MTGTNDKTEMQPPPAPSIKLKRISVRAGDRNVDRVTESVLYDGTLNNNEGREHGSPELQSNSTEVSSTTACTNLDADAEVSSTLSYGHEFEHIYIRPPSPSIIEVPVPPKPPPEVIDILEDEPSDISTEIQHDQELGIVTNLKPRNDDSIIARRNELLVTALRSEPERRSRTHAVLPPPVRQRLASKYGLTLPEFSNVATQSLISFHGPTYKVSTEEICNWYNNLAQSNGFVLLLKQALQSLMVENKKFALYSGVKKITTTECNQFKRLLKPELSNRKRRIGVQVFHQLSLQMTMESQLSYLQLSLCPNAAIPSPHGWSPVNSLFPFEAFNRIVDIQFTRKGEKFQLCTDALRVRYVELMSSHFASNSKQLLLAVFGAMGPDFGNCPLRILHILQELKLIGQNLGLPRCEASNKHSIFKPFDQSYGLKKRKITTNNSKNSSSQAKRLATIFVQPSDRTTCASSSSLLNSLNFAKSSSASSSAGHPIPPIQLNTLHDNPIFRTRNTTETEKLSGWKAATEEALENFHLPPLSSTGAQETFDRHTEYYGLQASCINPQFMQGMLAGISVAIKSWEEQKNRNQASCGFGVFSENSTWSPTYQQPAAQPSQNIAPQSAAYHHPATAQHVAPHDIAYQYPPTQPLQNDSAQSGSYSYALVQIPMKAGLPQLHHSHQNGLVPLPPHFAHSTNPSAP